MIENVERFKWLKINSDRYLTLEPFIKALNQTNITYVNIKGDVLSVQAYKMCSQRIYGDIDILVSIRNVRDVEQLLSCCGFTTNKIAREERILMISASHQTSSWQKTTTCGYNCTVDLNFDIFWGEYTGKRVDIDQFLSDTIEMEIYGVKVKTLPPLKAMVQLILHHYKEMNSIYHLAGHNCINYNMFKDVYFLLKNNKKDITLERLYSLCSEYEIIPYAFYVLYFTNWIFKDEDLQKFVDALRNAEGEYYLDYYGLAEKERKPWKVDFQTRLETDNLYELINDDLTEEDIEKLERNRRIFG